MREQIATESAKKILNEIRQAMEVHNIERILWEYLGEGDDGGIESVAYIDKEGNEIEFLPKDPGALEYLLWDLVQEYYEGFHNGNGGMGTGEIELSGVSGDGKLSFEINHQVREWVDAGGIKVTL